MQIIQQSAKKNVEKLPKTHLEIIIKIMWLYAQKCIWSNILIKKGGWMSALTNIYISF